jgi:AraC-like DNA-binding protein
MPASTYREMPPPTELAATVTCLWTRSSGGADPVTRVVPDGCVDIMWMTTTGGASRLVVAGPDTRAHLSSSAAGDAIAGVRLAPGAGAAVLGVPMHALRDDRPELAALWGARVGALAETVAGANRPEVALAAALTGAASPAPDPAMRHVARVLSAGCGPTPVKGLAAEMGMSERQLHRRCTAAFGYGAKTLHRVLRFQSALARARDGHDLARVAHECGYADQPHLARDVAALAGTSLTALVAG